MTKSATNDRLLLDCLTCRHRFHIRRRVASMVQVCPKCRHFVVPSEREVPPVRWIGPGAKAPAPRSQPTTISPPLRLALAVSPAQVAPAPTPYPLRPGQPSPDPLAVLFQFAGGFVLGFAAVVGFLLLLPLIILLLCVGSAVVVLLSVFAACFGRTPPRP